MTFALSIILYAFIACLLVRAVFSFIEPYPRNRVHQLTVQVTEPFISPVRRLVPPIGGFDLAFSIVFIAVLLILQLVQSVG
jgi:YggT family protein